MDGKETAKRKQVLEGNAFYEIDLECMRKKEKRVQTQILLRLFLSRGSKRDALLFFGVNLNPQKVGSDSEPLRGCLQLSR